ncbi:MAG TPA: ATP-binding protein [Humisphaera sp.]
MFGIRQKLALGFGGLLLILVVVSAVSLASLDWYSRTLERIFRENYDSVTYGQRMREAIEGLDDAAQASLFAGAGSPERPASEYRVQFQQNLDRELSNLTLPGEPDVARSIVPLWQQYQTAFDAVVVADAPADRRLGIYRDRLLPLTPQIKAKAQRVIELNLQNMVDTDGQVKQTAVAAKRALYALLATGIGLAVLVIAVIGRTLLQPLRALTKSAREIERGNLDLVVKARSRDEVGQLAEAFNAMAARLREFRRSDRARLARTERTTQLAVNSLPEGVAIVSPDGVVELANETARRCFALAPGTPVAASHHARLVELYRRAAATGRAPEPQGYESVIQVFDTGGQERFFLPHAVPIPGEDGSAVGVTLVLADVTNLRRIDEMKSGMLSVVSHELKTPLTSIRMGVHLLLEERVGGLTAKQAEILLAAREDADRLHQIIENLLDLGRMQAGRALMDLAAADPERLAAEAADRARSAYADKGVALRVEILPDLSPVLADADRLDHVFGNLLGNALKYTPAGGAVTLSAEPAEDGAAVRFAVTDTGPGIPPEHLPRAFERFFRVPGQPGGTGAGLGLAIAREVIEAHGGRAAAENVPGGGLRVSFTLPVAGAAASPVPAHAGRDEQTGRGVL